MLCWAAGVALLVGMAALITPPMRWSGSAVSWQSLLAPYGAGTPLPDGFRIDAIRRGGVNDVVLSVVRPDGSAAAEVHVLPRGCWSGIRESQSFGIGYETPHSPAPEREGIAEALAQAIRSRDRGLPLPDAIPLGGAIDARALANRLRGRRAALLAVSAALFGLLAWRRSRRLAAVGIAVAAADVLARAVGQPALADVCPVDRPADIIDLGVRIIQLGWAVLIVSAPVLSWRAGRLARIGGGRLLLVASAAAILALAAVWERGDEPLHANGHAWREAREVLQPWGERSTRAAPFLHGRGAAALEWMVASGERALTGTVNPFRISRIAGAAAAGSTAFLTAILVRSAGAGLAAGCVLALMPLARMLAVSGSSLAISAWLLPWSLGLLLAAGSFEDPILLAGAALAAALGILSHTAMLAWAAALGVAWVIVARAPLRWSRAAFGALLLVAIAWAAQLVNTREMLAERNQGSGLLAAARLGVEHRDLLLDARWVSPLLLPLAALGVLGGLLRRGRRTVLASALAACIAAVPFFAVTACSSDAVRYQAPLLGLVTSLAVAALWQVPLSNSELPQDERELWKSVRGAQPRRGVSKHRWPFEPTAAGLGAVGLALLRLPLLAALAFLPRASRQSPLDPVAAEHSLVQDAAARMQAGTLIVLPASPLGRDILVDFPDFLLPPDTFVAFADDPRVATHAGPRLLYLGLACISWDGNEEPGDRSQPRPECRALRAGARPWLVRTLTPADLPRLPDGTAWTFHQLGTDVPFGFFAPASGES